MNELLQQLLTAAKNDKKAFKKLKGIAVELRQYEIAGELREIEKKIFPESEVVKAAKKEAEKLNLVFRMVDLNIPLQSCWVISETLKLYNEKGGDFDIKDAVSITCAAEEYFG